MGRLGERCGVAISGIGSCNKRFFFFLLVTYLISKNNYVSYLMRSIYLLPFFISLQVNRQIQKV